MTTSTPTTLAIRPGGHVADPPRTWLRIEGALLAGAAVYLFARTHQSWWLVPPAFLAPDLFMLGYARSPRVGALAYNLAHTSSLPLALGLIGFAGHHHLVTALALLWLLHIGVDRAAGYGLKYPDAFTHTHLGLIGKARPTPVPARQRSGASHTS